MSSSVVAPSSVIPRIQIEIEPIPLCEPIGQHELFGQVPKLLSRLVQSDDLLDLGEDRDQSPVLRQL